MEFVPQQQLQGMRNTLITYKQEIARWDKPVSGFNESQQLALSNLFCSIEETLEYFNTAIENLEDYK